MMVISPSDYVQTQKAVECASKHIGPVYIRLSRLEVPCVFDAKYEFNPEKAIILKGGVDVTLITTGDILSEVIQATEKLEENLQSMFPKAYIVRMDADSTAAVTAANGIVAGAEAGADAVTITAVELTIE